MLVRAQHIRTYKTVCKLRRVCTNLPGQKAGLIGLKSRELGVTVTTNHRRPGPRLMQDVAV